MIQRYLKTLASKRQVVSMFLFRLAVKNGGKREGKHLPASKLTRCVASIIGVGAINDVVTV